MGSKSLGSQESVGHNLVTQQPITGQEIYPQCAWCFSKTEKKFSSLLFNLRDQMLLGTLSALAWRQVYTWFTACVLTHLPS